MFKVKSVVVKVDTLKFSIRDLKHDFLYKTFKLLAICLVQKQIQDTKDSKMGRFSNSTSTGQK